MTVRVAPRASRASIGRMRRRTAISLIICALSFVACTGSNGTPGGSGDAAPTTVTSEGDIDPEPVGDPTTIAVPGDFPTIQAAVDAARPGDMVLVAPGIYREAVAIRTPFVTVRGTDRNTVILDGGDELDNGILAAANGIAVENLTIRRYVVNGLLFTKAYDADDPENSPPLRGYRASYVTAYNNQQYGIYAFFAQDGLIEHSYASGHPDSGLYIGQCKPCNAVVTDVVMERNAIGYSGTNASGNLTIVNSVWRRNRIGMTPNSQNLERLSPQGDVVIAGNLVADNDDRNTPSTPEGAFGFGIAVGGGNRNEILRNRVIGNSTAGISVSDLNEFRPSGNRIDGNVVEGNGVDLAMYLQSSAQVPPDGNCFAGNTFGSSSPVSIETALPCDGSAGPFVGEAARFAPGQPPGVDYRSIAAPPPQPNMPDAATAPARPARDLPPRVDLASITVPPVPTS